MSEQVLGMEYLIKKLKELEELKGKMENGYYQLLGQISLIKQQIEELQRQQQSSVKE